MSPEEVAPSTLDLTGSKSSACPGKSSSISSRCTLAAVMALNFVRNKRKSSPIRNTRLIEDFGPRAQEFAAVHKLRIAILCAGVRLSTVYLTLGSKVERTRHVDRYYILHVFVLLLPYPFSQDAGAPPPRGSFAPSFHVLRPSLNSLHGAVAPLATSGAGIYAKSDDPLAGAVERRIQLVGYSVAARAGLLAQDLLL